MLATKPVSVFLTAACLVSASPNLLLAYLDQWRFDWAGFNDPEIRAPNLASIASKGTRFTHAFTPAPLCAPARGALASGKDYDESPVPDNLIDYPIDGSAPTYYSKLKQAGYHIMMAGKDHLSMASGVGADGSIHASACGFDDWERMPDKYEVFNDDYKPTYEKGKPYDQWSEGLEVNSVYNSVSACYGVFGNGSCCDQIQGLEGGAFCPRIQPIGEAAVVYPDDWTEMSAERLLDRRPANKSWFMQVGFPGPHPPFILTEAMNKSVEGRIYPMPQGSQDSFGTEFYQVMRRQYAAEIENIDTLIGKLVSKLMTAGELDNTIIAIAADHGEMLGDYNKYAKSMPWDGSSRVPMLFMGPGVQAGATVSQPVTTLDIVGTFLELAGAEKADNMTTQSLWSLLSSGNGGRSYISSGLGSTTFQGDFENEDYLTAQFPPSGGGVNWRMVVKQMNGTSTLKLVCCPEGCNSINGNHSLFPSSSDAQVGLFEISGNSARLEIDLLSRGVGNSEASELITYLPPAYKTACQSAFSTQSQQIVV